MSPYSLPLSARASQKLPPLKRSAQLERAGQAQSNSFARTGSGSHGSSLSDIAARFIKVGYHPAAYDEAFDDLAEGATPYLFLYHMLGHASIPCSEIFDPRFRAVGIGATVAGVGIDTLALEFGLRVGQRQRRATRGRRRPARTRCRLRSLRDASRWHCRADREWVDGQPRAALHCPCVVHADLDADAPRRARECGQWERHDRGGRCRSRAA